MREQTDTVVIGAGHAGLAVSHELTRRNVPHVVLERGRPGEVWRSQRWDSFTMVTPNWLTHLPGLPYDGPDPDGFMSRAEWLAYLDRYVASFGPPLECGVEVIAVRRSRAGGDFMVETTAGDFCARHVVVATGMHQVPRIPAVSAALGGGVTQLHTSTYHNPAQLPPGGVLVIGTGQSGSQIAEELYKSGRRVALSVGRAGRYPRRYRGRDLMWWVFEAGFSGVGRPYPASLSTTTGRDGGRDLNLHRFARDGVTLLGRLEAMHGTRVWFAPDLHLRLGEADATYASFRRNADAHVAAAGIDLPADQPPADALLRDGFAAPVLREIDLAAAGIHTVIWGTGFRHDFSWVHLPVFDAAGYPITDRGVTAEPGLFIVGARWQVPGATTLVGRIAVEAAHVAEVLG